MDDCEAIWQTTWPRLPPRVLEAVASVEWGQFLMQWPRTVKIDGAMSDINLHRVAELIAGLRDPEVDLAVLTVPEAWIPLEELR
eukprot:841101-Karenia_brevis.AAC.1